MITQNAGDCVSLRTVQVTHKKGILYWMRSLRLSFNLCECGICQFSFEGVFYMFTVWQERFSGTVEVCVYRFRVPVLYLITYNILHRIRTLFVFSVNVAVQIQTAKVQKFKIKKNYMLCIGTLSNPCLACVFWANFFDNYSDKLFYLCHKFVCSLQRPLGRTIVNERYVFFWS